METIKPKSAINNRTNKLAKTFHKFINFREAVKTIASSSSSSSNGICLLSSQPFAIKSKHKGDRARNRAIMEALIARLFAGVTAIKASYAELQMAQKPYNNEAIQAADQAVVDELRAISELKRKFVKKELDLSPQVTLMLAEIQEQQSLMKTYELTIKKLESEVELKQSESSSLKKKLDELTSFNKSLEKKLNSSGSLPMFDNLQLSKLNPTHFVQFLELTLRSIKSFVKLLIREMESAHWDLQAAAKFIHPQAVFSKSSHIAFESFVCLTIFEGFNFPNFSVPNEPISERKVPHKQNQNLYFEKFKKAQIFEPKTVPNPQSNLIIREILEIQVLSSCSRQDGVFVVWEFKPKETSEFWGFPDSVFFTSFAEMAKRVWDLHFLALSFDEEVSIFQVRKNSRFSEVYMECVNVAESDSSVSESGSEEAAAAGGSGGAVELRVGFTVVPGFKVDKTVVQSQVYLSPPAGLPAT